MRTWTASLLAACSVCSAAGASPEDELVAAATRFLAQPSYSWGASTTLDGMDQQNSMFSEATEGQHEMGGYTKAWFLVGPHIPRQDWGASEPWPGITDDDAHFSNRWVFLTPEGWKPMRKIPPPIDPSDMLAGAGIRTDVGEIAGGELGNSAPITVLEAQVGTSGYMLRYAWFGFWRPDQEITVIMEHRANVTEPASGVYDVELTPEGVELLANPRPPAAARFLGVPWGLSRPEVSVRVVLDRGELTSYKLDVSGTWAFQGKREHVRCLKRRNLTNVGTTTIDLPDGLAEMLGR
jgi:hypothetical protein